MRAAALLLAALGLAGCSLTGGEATAPPVAMLPDTRPIADAGAGEAASVPMAPAVAASRPIRRKIVVAARPAPSRAPSLPSIPLPAGYAPAVPSTGTAAAPGAIPAARNAAIPLPTVQ